MKIRPLIASLCLFWSFSAAAQVTSEFYLSKSTFAPDEPIFLYFRVSNRGDQPVTINTTQLPEQPLCAGYTVNISRDSANTQKCLQLRSVNSCILNGQFSSEVIPPGKTYTEQIFLNPYADFGTAGNYSIDAKYFDNLRSKDFRVTPISITTEATLHLNIDPNAPFAGSDVFQAWVKQLQSPQRRERIEAARVLTYLAPPAFENVLLGFVDNPEFRRFAPLAFHNLNSPRSVAALAALVNGPTTNEQIEAVGYLADTGDQKFLPLLLDAAQQHAGISSFPAAATVLGGDKAIPTLLALEEGPDRKFAALNAVRAMGYTGSRKAIPPLLEYLKSSEPGIAERANASLEMLTHRTGSPRQRITPAMDYPNWAQWWEREGATAPIYRSTGLYCGPLVPLDQQSTRSSRNLRNAK